MIRTAVPDDGPDLMRMGESFFAESGHAASFAFDRASFAHTCTVLGMAGLLLVVEHEGKVVGMAAADVAPSICNHSVLFARECFWYVDPPFRKGVGRKLLPALEALVRDRGASAFDVVAEVGKRSDALARVYRAGGFNPVENTSRKWLKQCPSAPSLAA